MEAQGFSLGLLFYRENAMILRIDHIAIAVRDYPKARAFFDALFNTVPGAAATVDSTKYHWQLMSVGDLSRLELLSPTGEGSFLDGFLKNKEGGVHHITVQTRDIKEARQRLDELSIPYFGYNEYPGGVWNELFIHPKDAFGVLIQIAEFRSEDWLNPALGLKDGKKWQASRTEKGANLTVAHPGGATFTLELDKTEIKNLINDLSAMI
jgi:methylmalonyl-CoA/ethylmalonyl-CoA epimerase